MKKIVAIVGPSASGKNTLLEELKSCLINYNFVKHITTRPKREKEIDGIEYNFITDEEMIKKILNNEIISAANYRGWVYGIEEKALADNKINIGDFSLEDLDNLRYNNNIKLYIIYLTAASKIRFIRSLQRESNPNIDEIYRRYLSDDEDFYWFEEDLVQNVYKHYITIDTTDKDIEYDKVFNFLEKIENEEI